MAAGGYRGGVERKMSDQSIGSATTTGRLSRLLRYVARIGTFRQLPQGVAIGLATIIVGFVLAFYWSSEGEPANIAFTVGVTAALMSLVALISRRALFSVALTSAVVGIIVGAATVKHATMNMVVHAYDLFFYLSSWSTISFLWDDHRRYVVALVAALGAMAIGGWLVYRLDSTRVPRLGSSLALCFAIGVALVGAAQKGERRHMQFYFQNLYVSSFFASWGETLQTLWNGTMLEASSKSPDQVAFRLPADCKVSEKPPHIILIHQESIVPPGQFPSLGYDRSVDSMFKSQDGLTRKLRVETYGGASWLTEFSILAGVSTESFGGMRQFVQTFLQNKLKDTLPQSLEQCGYRNVVFYPMLKNFVSNDKFYNSVGLKEIFDLKAQGAKVVNERDSFYYTNALNEMERHVASSSKPLFTYVQTMSAHWPYDIAFKPDEIVPGGAPGTHPEMHEYLRRVSLAKQDYDFLISEVKKRFKDERVLIVHYGDHQPTATRMLLGYGENTEAEDVVIGPNSPGFLTYFALDGVNYTVPHLPRHETVDVPYLGMIIQDAAGLPLSDANRERKRLMALCQGRYNSCAKRDEILAFHRRLIDAGIIVAR
jgi:phosphoglycerol transferase MdoB-like AlkP superfamily enzyme